MEIEKTRLFHIFKVVRIIVGFKLLNYKIYRKQIHDYLKSATEKKLQGDADLASSQIEDFNNIERLIKISTMLKTFQLIVYLLCGSYLTGLFWYIFCKFVTPQAAESGELSFNESFDLGSDGEQEQILVKLTYFAFTSLSTVGLGDMHPISSNERLVGAFVLLFGVSLTSYIIDQLNRALVTY